VPLSPAAVEVLKMAQDLCGESPWAFPMPKDPKRYLPDVQRWRNSLRDLAGVEFVPHDIRRTVASLMAGARVQRLVIAKILNHTDADREITATYDRHSYDDEKREALEAWAVQLRAIVG
jgi:integrase